MPDSSGATVLDDLPDQIIIEEILVRLPAEDVLRCRAVRRSWRVATSTPDFLLAHHGRQPSLPVIDLVQRDGKFFDRHLFVFCDGAANRKLCRPVLWYPDPRPDKDTLVIHAACDGLLLIFHEPQTLFDVCNPVTRQRAPLPLPCEDDHDQPSRRIRIAGFYRYRGSREYGVLYWMWTNNDGHIAAEFYVLKVVSDEAKPVGQLPIEPALLEVLNCSSNAPVLHGASLHWGPGAVGKIMAFDTAAETFRWICRPAQLGPWVSLLEMDGVLAACSSRDGIVIDFSVMQDYKAEVWAFKCRINLSAVKASPPLDLTVTHVGKIAMLNERELLIELSGRVLHCDIDGRYFRNVECDEGKDTFMRITSHRFQESLIQHPFFEMQDYENNEMQKEEDDEDEMYYSKWP